MNINSKSFAEDLWDFWPKWRKDNRGRVKDKMHHGSLLPKGATLKISNYHAQMLYPLLFWQFVIFCRKSDVKESVLVVFLSSFLEDSSKLVRLIAKIELLPTVVWRKLLWKENMDFLSMESFLRRITPNQEKAIDENYNDYVECVVPRVFRKGWRDRTRVKLGVINFAWITDVDQEMRLSSGRYKSKAAWIYNLFKIDFGFAIYEKGEGDDTKTVSKSVLKFLVAKDNINDFVVNTEDGKYWWAYRAARKNYVYGPRNKKEVVLKDWICPGLWVTLFLHLYFWIVSPIIFTYCLIGVNNFEAGNASMPLVAGLIFGLGTPLWLILASIFGLIKLIVPHSESIQNFFDIAKSVVVAIVVAALVLLACFGIPVLAFSFAVGLGVNSVVAGLFGLAICFHFITAAFYVLDEADVMSSRPYYYGSLPKWLRKTLLGVLIVGLFSILYQTVLPEFFTFLADTFWLIIDLSYGDWKRFAFVVVTLLSMVLMGSSVILLGKSERIFARLARGLEILVWICAIAIAVLTTYLVLVSGVTAMIAITSTVTLFGLGFVLNQTERVNIKTVDLYDKADILFRLMDESSIGRTRILMFLRYNRWLAKRSEDELIRLVDEYRVLAGKFNFRDVTWIRKMGGSNVEIFHRVLPSVFFDSVSGFKHISTLLNSLPKNYEWDFFPAEQIRLSEFVGRVLAGRDPEVVIDQFKQDRDYATRMKNKKEIAKLERRKKRSKFFKPLEEYFETILTALAFVFSFIPMVVAFSKRITSSCPKNSEQVNLDEKMFEEGLEFDR